MTKQAQVGLFVILGAIAVFVVFYVLSDLGTRTRGYKVGVHFAAASGLHRAAPVSLSGVTIGAVDDIQLEPDYSVDVILAISPGFEIPKNSSFQIAVPFTGEANVVIAPPKGIPVATLPHEILPLDEQPQGTHPASLQDLLDQGQGEAKRFDRILAQLERKTPRVLDEMDTALRNVNELTLSAKTSVAQLSLSANGMMETLNRSAGRAGNNVVDLTQQLDMTVKRNSAQIDSMIAKLNRMTTSFNQSADSLRDIATNPKVKQDLLDTTHAFAVTAKTFADLSNDLRQVTGNPQTQAQLRDTVARFDSTAQKIDSLLGSIGGKSEVYGVDRNATPAPGGVTPPPPGFVPTSKPALAPPGTPTGPLVPAPRSALPPQSGPSPAPQGSAAPNLIVGLKARLNSFTKDLAELQIRVSQLSPLEPPNVRGNLSPLLTADRGPMTDFNVSLLPRMQTGLLVGINDAGGATSTANFMLLSHKNGFEYGAGMEYSRLGLIAALNGQKAGVEARIYDLRHPTFDAYGNIVVTPKLQLFGGERDIFHTDRRSVFGFQFSI
jgi:phospholipid/cholesterol/gamma-HCH transport system substrate-binding protein